jgi:hypothetical protein
MDGHDPSRELAKPISAWNKPFKSDFKGLFKSLTKAVAHGATGKWEELIPDGGEALSSIGLKSEPAELAWLLIRRALIQAISDLVRENVTSLNINASMIETEQLDHSLAVSEIRLDRSFFDRPTDLAVVGNVQAVFKEWLLGHSMLVGGAQAVTARLPYYFVYALRKEWRNHSQTYAPIRENTPYDAAAEREDAWSYYNAWLIKQANIGVFNETFGLHQIYVPLRAYYKEKELDESSLSLTPGMELPKRFVIDLEQELTSWLDGGAKGDALRVISGGPGSGKSTFAKIFAAHLAERGTTKVLFVPMHLFDLKGDLVNAVGEFVKGEGRLLDNPLDPKIGEKRLLLIFDGLDELAMDGKLAQEICRQFIREVEKVLDRATNQERKIYALISGREMIIQAQESDFRKVNQILHLLPYYITDTKGPYVYVGPDEVKQLDQRQQWWQQYGAITSAGYSGMPDVLTRKDLEEITSQPLLNYLVALSFKRGELDFTQEINRNRIYADLVRAVYERGWAGHLHPAVRGMKFDDFDRVLEEIGLAVWHGNGRTATVSEIHEHCKNANISRLLEVFQAGAEAGVTRLLLAFFFRRSGRNSTGEERFEFTHKSFGEYLAARRLVRGMERMRKELISREQDLDSGWDERTALSEWAKLCGPSSLDQYILSFLADEIKVRGIARALQEVMAPLICFMLTHGMPMEELNYIKSYKETTRQARNSEEGLLLSFGACSRSSRVIEPMDWPDSSSFSRWISKLLVLLPSDDESSIAKGLIHRYLSYLDIRNQNLIGYDFSGANMEGTHFIQALLLRADFEQANLINADLQEANMLKVNLTDANLAYANLKGATLIEANLLNANFEGAILIDAILDGTDLSEVEGLTYEQIASASTDEKTILPLYLASQHPST